MLILKRLSKVMELPWAYALWQTPFLRAKFAPVERHNDLASVQRILDVGCGPGTNARFFTHAAYVGLDINAAYVARARQKYGRTFIEADVCTYNPPPDQRYDFVLLNSLLHHIDDEGVDRILRTLHNVVVDHGHIHILDLVLPDEPSLARSLARNDRGDYPRPVRVWKELLHRHFVPTVEEIFPVGVAGIELWRMLYFKAQPRH